MYPNKPQNSGRKSKQTVHDQVDWSLHMRATFRLIALSFETFSLGISDQEVNI